MGSPFVGGGSVEIFMQAKGVRVFGGDLCRELACMWQALLSDPARFAEDMRAEVPIPYPMHSLRRRLETSEDSWEVGVLTWLVLKGGFSYLLRDCGGSPRNVKDFNRSEWRSTYARLRRFRAERLSVEHLDCFSFMEKYPDMFLYCDPPYCEGTASQDLYGYKGELHAGFDHERLAQMLMERGNFALSYGDCERVRDLYAGCRFIEMQWRYGMSDRSGHELLIMP